MESKSSNTGKPAEARPQSQARREFLTASGLAVAAAAVPATVSTLASAAASPEPQAQGAPMQPIRKLRKIPIGVFDPVFPNLTVDEMIEKISGWGIEAVEIGAGGYPGNKHCPVDELLGDAAKAKAWKKKFEDRNIQVATLSCHGNPVHPDAKLAARDAQAFRNTILLAEKLDVKVVVGFSGCPGGSPTDTMPNWATYRWPPEYAQVLDWQWKERVIPYWKETAKFAREHGIHRIALEMHPGFVVYNPRTLLQLREAAGEEVGANCDLSHLFWQQCDPIAVIKLLAANGALFHAHMKDTVLFRDNVGKYGVLNFAFEPKDLGQASETFRAVGYGHSANTWKDIVRTYMEVGYQGILSIENEDPILAGEEGVQRALTVLKNVREEILNPPAGHNAIPS
jgi:sugar phosphate isomerase/epimerase